MSDHVSKCLATVFFTVSNNIQMLGACFIRFKPFIVSRIEHDLFLGKFAFNAALIASCVKIFDV